MKEMSIDSARKILLESPRDLSDVMKAAAHPHRLQILALLAEGPTAFSDLLDVTKVSKTALANHLTHMMNKGLIERSDRGLYQMTKDGHDLLTAVAAFYAGSQARELHRAKRVKNQFARGYRAVKDGVDEKIVSNPPLIQDTWLTYVGAVTGVLQWLGTDCDVIDVGGYSGYTFLVNVARGATCASGPTAHEAWKEIHKGTESLGWKLTGFSDERPFPLSEEMTPEDRARAWAFFEMIRKRIDEHERPVVMWGIPVPEYGIVTGYTQDAYVVSTVRRFNSNQPEPPIRYDALQAPGCMEALFFGEEIPVPKNRDRDALNRMLSMAEGSFVRKGYVTGPAAYDEWAAVLETGALGKMDYFGNSYVGACVHDSKGLAARFLERLAQRHARNSQGDFLARAAEAYYKAEKFLGTFVKLFPILHEGVVSSELCQKGAEVLRAARDCEIAAISHLRMTCKNWE